MKQASVSVRKTSCGLGTLVAIHGVEVAFIQGATPDELKVKDLKNWTRVAFEGMSKDDIVEAVQYGGINRLTQDDFAL